MVKLKKRKSDLEHLIDIYDKAYSESVRLDAEWYKLKEKFEILTQKKIKANNARKSAALEYRKEAGRSHITSPCNQTCTIVSGNCTGCGRTLSEIKRWSKATDDEQRQITKLSKKRIKK